jgi:nitroreductase
MNMKSLRNLLLGAGILLLGSCNQAPVSAPAEPAPVDKAAIVLENIMTRASVRSFTAEPVSRETLQTIVRAGLQAPSAMNKQDWEVRVVDSQDKINAICDIMKKANPNAQDRFPGKNSFGNAAALIFIANEVSDQPGAFSAVDAALLAENIVLAAHAMDLGACIQAGPLRSMESAEAQAWLKSLGFSENYQPMLVIPIGHPDQEVTAGQRDASKAKFVE